MDGKRQAANNSVGELFVAFWKAPDMGDELWMLLEFDIHVKDQIVQISWNKGKHLVNHVFFPQISVSNFVLKISFVRYTNR